MAGEVQNLTREVSEAKTIMQSAKTLINGLRDALEKAVANNDMGAVQALSDQLSTESDSLAAAIQANTPLPAPGPGGGEV